MTARKTCAKTGARAPGGQGVELLMTAGMVRITLGAVALLLAGCGGGDKTPELMNIRSQSRAPDEFTIIPAKPLVLPEDMAALPDPTPGGRNITDPTPEADAIAALGGDPSRAGRIGPVPGVDGGLMAHVGRFGFAPSIRDQLAAEDLEHRRKNDGRLLERWFNVNVYYRAYERMSLDKYVELERWRAAGARTSAAPPDPAIKN